MTSLRASRHLLESFPHELGNVIVHVLVEERQLLGCHMVDGDVVDHQFRSCPDARALPCAGSQASRGVVAKSLALTSIPHHILGERELRLSEASSVRIGAPRVVTATVLHRTSPLSAADDPLTERARELASIVAFRVELDPTTSAIPAAGSADKEGT